MDDSQKTQPIQNPTYTSDGAVQNGVPVQNTPAIGSVHREIERPVTDFLKPTESQPAIEQELREAGVEQVAQKPDLTADHKNVGIKHSLENTEPNPNAHKNIKFPLTESEIDKIEKGGDTNASAYWLSVLLLKIKKALALT